MRHTQILLLITALGIASCSNSGSAKKLTSGVKSEFLEDSSKAQSKYLNSEIEITGYFDYDEESKKWDFNVLDSNMHNQEDDSTDANTLVSDFAQKVHGLRLGINTDLDNNVIEVQHIVSPLKVSGGYWVYDKAKDKFYNTQQWGNIDDVIKILSKEGGTYRMDMVDPSTNVQSTEDVKVNDTTIEMLDNHLKNWTKDISSIQHNDIMYLPVSKYQKMKIIDVVTIKGKVEDLTRRTGVYELLGTIDMLVVNLKDVKVVKKERVNISNFILLDYQAKQKMITGK